MHDDALEANPGASAQELIAIKRAALWKAVHEAQKKKSQDENISSLPSPLIGIDNEKVLRVRGPAQNALLDEFRLSLTQAQRSDLYAKVREENPDANSSELAKNLRAEMLTAALEARRKKMQDEKDSSSPPPLPAGSASKAAISPADLRDKDGSLSMLPLGAFKPASPLSLQAQSKSGCRNTRHMSMCMPTSVGRTTTRI